MKKHRGNLQIVHRAAKQSATKFDPLAVSESVFRGQIQPMLEVLAERCKAYGFDLVAQVEWFPGQTHLTTVQSPSPSQCQRLVKQAADSRGSLVQFLAKVSTQ